MTRFDPKTGWITPWPFDFGPDELAPFVDDHGRDTFDGRQVRDAQWYQRDRRRQARVAIRHLDELLADGSTDLDTVLTHAVDVIDGLAAGKVRS